MTFRLLLITLIHVCFCAYATTSQTSVTAHKDRIIYFGEMSDSANDALLSLLNEYPHTFSPLVITSPSGEVNEGMDLGDIVFSHHLNMNADDYCLSSCANYVFTSAPRHRISNRAVFGFHADVTGMEDNIDTRSSRCRKVNRPQPEQIFAHYIQNAAEREQAFLRKSGWILLSLPWAKRFHINSTFLMKHILAGTTQ